MYSGPSPGFADEWRLLLYVRDAISSLGSRLPVDWHRPGRRATSNNHGSREAEFRVDSSSDITGVFGSGRKLRHELLAEAFVGPPFAFSSNSRHLVCASLCQPPLTTTYGGQPQYEPLARTSGSRATPARGVVRPLRGDTSSPGERRSDSASREES